ncbi:host attachment protein [Gallaecimonas sp. GXIMD4217]|uniref:host attachment protein n=1 Tax=Gallaecimonas sp. GXIMD4217 TaxID=3131927 RepID=UPI00311B2860
MKDTWLVVADSSRARFFDVADRKGTLKELDALAHPESRLHEGKMTSDRPGHARDGNGMARYSIDSDQGAKTHEAMRFAKEVSQYLEAKRQGKAYEQLVLVASPKFLGQLRNELTPSSRALVIGEYDKALGQLDCDEIAGHLPAKYWELH